MDLFARRRCPIIQRPILVQIRHFPRHTTYIHSSSDVSPICCIYLCSCFRLWLNSMVSFISFFPPICVCLLYAFYLSFHFSMIDLDMNRPAIAHIFLCCPTIIIIFYCTHVKGYWMLLLLLLWFFSSSIYSSHMISLKFLHVSRRAIRGRTHNFILPFRNRKKNVENRSRFFWKACTHTLLCFILFFFLPSSYILFVVYILLLLYRLLSTSLSFKMFLFQ